MKMKRMILSAAFAGLALAMGGSAQSASLRFDGTDDSIVVADAMELTGPMTLEAWVYVESATGGGRIISNRNSANGYEFMIYDGGEGDPELWFGANGGLEILAPFARTRFNSWMHVAFTYDGPVAGNMKLFVDGVEVASDVRHTTINETTGPLRIGAMGGSGGFNFHGGIDEVRIWNTSLSGETLAGWRNAEVTAAHPNYGALEGYWRFEEGAGQTAASVVNSPALDAMLGQQAGVDASDPTWSETGVATEAATFGSIKAGVGFKRR